MANQPELANHDIPANRMGNILESHQQMKITALGIDYFRYIMVCLQNKKLERLVQKCS